MAFDFGLDLGDMKQTAIKRFEQMLSVDEDKFKQLQVELPKGKGHDKVANIAAFTKYVKFCTEMLKKANQLVFANTAYKDYFSQNKSFGTIKKMNPIPDFLQKLDPENDSPELLKKKKDFKASATIPQLEVNYAGTQIPISYGILSSVDALKAAYQKFTSKDPTPANLSDFLSVVKSQLGTV